MRNEDVAEAMRQLETNFKLHSEMQLANYTKLLEQYMASMDLRFGQVNLKLQEVSGEKGTTSESAFSEGDGGRKAREGGKELTAYLKGFKFDIPKFNGEEVHNWIFKIEKYFSLHSIPSTVQVQMVAFHFEGEAASWYQWMDRNGSLVDWDQFLSALRERFGSSIYDDPLGRIAKLMQTGSVARFRTDFEELMNRVVGVSEPMFLNFFIWGLRPEIRRELLINPPSSLTEAMVKAQLFEDRNEDFRGTLQKEMMQAGSVAVVPSQDIAVPKIPIKRLTPAEIQEKRAKGLCFSCDEKYNANHHCKNQVMVFLGEEMDGSSEGLEFYEDKEHNLEGAEDAIVGLHTLTSASNPRVFRITATYQKGPIEVLIDTGSHNNFIQEGLVEKLGVPCTLTKRFRVYTGSGQYLWCDKICSKVLLVLQGHEFYIDLYVLPIWGLEVILGIQWLRTLGPCLHDHEALTMEFSCNGQRVCLNGNRISKSGLVFYNQFCTLASEESIGTFSTLVGPPIEAQITEFIPGVELGNSIPAQGKHNLKKYKDVFSQPNTLMCYLRGGISLATVKETLIDRGKVLQNLRQHLHHSQHHMTQLVDIHRKEKHFQIGDFVQLKLTPYPQTMEACMLHTNPCQRFFGLYQLLSKLRPGGYTLQSPHITHMHPTSHVTQFQACQVLHHEDKVNFDDGGSDKPIMIETRLKLMDQQIRDWAVKGMICQEQAHLGKCPEIRNESSETEEEISKEFAAESSRDVKLQHG